MAEPMRRHPPVIKFVTSLPVIATQPHDILIYDKILVNGLKDFIGQFPNQIGLPSGEATKDLQKLVPILDQVVGFNTVTRPRFFALGGGSIGDLVGFIASIYKRGSDYISIPTTWLSAIDSAHGGKTALNVGGIKNVIGSFYEPDTIFIVQDILEQLPPELKVDAWSELIKIGLIDSEKLYLELCSHTDSIWSVLPQAIEAKYQTVRLDPFETNGIRRKLNLGHTLGHALESGLGLSHGKSVGFGIRFALYLSQKYNYLEQAIEVPGIPSLDQLIELLKHAPDLRPYLEQDKKNEGHQCHFVFIRKPGDVFTEAILIPQLLDELSLLCGSK